MMMKMWWESHSGHGPWRHLPPWKRPGYWFGRSWCWWSYPHAPPWLDREDEIKYLEDLKKYINDVVLREIDRRLQELKESK